MTARLDAATTREQAVTYHRNESVREALRHIRDGDPVQALGVMLLSVWAQAQLLGASGE